MNAPKSPPASMNRRANLQHLGFLGSGLFLFACGGTNGENSGNLGGAGGAATGGTGTSAETGGAGGAGSAGEWATGGTASMSGSYPNPFPSSVTACTVPEEVTEGPCTEAADQVRVDISEGYTGLPMRLALLVVDTSCNPVSGAKVKVWHTQITGSYSGDTPNNQMCLKDQADSAKHYFRGVQTTDASGRVNFDSCFPGWYSGRAVHIHFTVSIGSSSFTSQLAFDQALIADIFENHPEYSPYGQPDTSNANDNIVGGANLATFTLETSRQEDGSLLAAKMLVVDL